MHIVFKSTVGNVLFEWRLCSKCARMMCLNNTNYLLIQNNGMWLHKHVVCPSLKKGLFTQLLLGG